MPPPNCTTRSTTPVSPRAELESVERAAQRLAAGTYGISVESGEPIPDERLEVFPTAERTAAEQERFERGSR